MSTSDLPIRVAQATSEIVNVPLQVIDLKATQARQQAQANAQAVLSTQEQVQTLSQQVTDKVTKVTGKDLVSTEEIAKLTALYTKGALDELLTGKAAAADVEAIKTIIGPEGGNGNQVVDTVRELLSVFNDFSTDVNLVEKFNDISDALQTSSTEIEAIKDDMDFSDFGALLEAGAYDIEDSQSIAFNIDTFNQELEQRFQEGGQA